MYVLAVDPHIFNSALPCLAEAVAVEGRCIFVTHTQLSFAIFGGTRDRPRAGMDRRYGQTDFSWDL